MRPQPGNNSEANRQAGLASRHPATRVPKGHGAAGIVGIKPEPSSHRRERARCEDARRTPPVRADGVRGGVASGGCVQAARLSGEGTQ